MEAIPNQTRQHALGKAAGRPRMRERGQECSSHKPINYVGGFNGTFISALFRGLFFLRPFNDTTKETKKKCPEMPPEWLQTDSPCGELDQRLTAPVIGTRHTVLPSLIGSSTHRPPCPEVSLNHEKI